MNPTSPELERALLARLTALPFEAFTEVVRLLLQHEGYTALERVPKLSRTGRTRSRSYDLSAFLPVPGGQRRVLVRLKQYPSSEPVSRRHIDELRGVTLAAGASEAVLVTTSTFSKSLEPTGLASAPLLPVRLLDGHQLALLCATHRVGVWEELGSSADEPTRRSLDDAFFQQLVELVPVKPDTSNLKFKLTLVVRERKSAPRTRKAAALPRRS